MCNEACLLSAASQALRGFHIAEGSVASREPLCIANELGENTSNRHG